jgi:predicted ATPase
LCVALLQPERPIIILLDEPELGLHPTAVKILAGLIRKASNFSQLIISTQSRELIDEFQAENIVVVENEEGHSTFNRLHNQELAYWTEKYSMAEIWDRNVIGGRP